MSFKLKVQYMIMELLAGTIKGKTIPLPLS